MDVYYTFNGKIVHDYSDVPKCLLRVHFRLRGGKGGFGSMLRAIGARIEKTTNHEACRDLSGRRMRDVNNEKKIAEWMQTQEEKNQEKLLKRQKRNERILAQTANPKLEGSEYTTNIQGNAENVIDAIKMAKSTNTTLKRKGTTTSTDLPKKVKKGRMWTGVEDSSDDSSGDSDDDSASPRATDLGNDENMVVASTATDSDTTVLQKSNDSPKKNNETLDSNSDEVDDQNSKTQNGDQNIIIKTTEEVKPSPVDEPTGFTQYKSAEQLQALGLERLKNELKSLGQKCGGTLQQRAERLFQYLSKQPDN